jgi:hypothetical protein
METLLLNKVYGFQYIESHLGYLENVIIFQFYKLYF